MPEALSYDLHKLGWRAFQDLSAVLLQTALGQSFHSFADSNDGGRDGAFFGGWFSENVDSFAELNINLMSKTPVVAQCKFSASGVGTLTPSAVASELEKVNRLKSKGLCEAYILITNLRVSGKTEEWLIRELASRGVSQVLVLDGAWICQQINVRPTLRRQVPRMYGLGDLSQILDERRFEQAKVLLSVLGDDLATFVPTASYRQAADALANHGFTLLLGAPAAGKSTIAAMLSTAALDEWNCGVIRVDSPAELIEAWNPHEGGRLFWVDDAFGAIRCDQQLVDQWARRLDQIMSAVRHGAKIVLTSRDYIYQQARTHLKEYAYPLLREQAVVVDVDQLTRDERQQILYNHLRAGDQPAGKLKEWRPHLAAIADLEAFQPEIARRLGRQAFTGAIDHGYQLVEYVKHPRDFLKDVLLQLEPAARAALACVYLYSEGIQLPIQFSDQVINTITLLGSTAAETAQAFAHLDGSFLILVLDSGAPPRWQFRHPTLREGFAASIANNPNVLHVLVAGLSDEEVMRQVDCGGTEAGTLVKVPVSMYHEIAKRISLESVSTSDDWYAPIGQFLTRRCSDQFLQIWASENNDNLFSLLKFEYLMGTSWRLTVLARLQVAGVLPLDVQRQAVEILEKRSVEDLDIAWADSDVVGLFRPTEKDALLQRVKDEVIPQLDRLVEQSADGYDRDVEPSSRYAAAQEAVAAYIDIFDADPEILQTLQFALQAIDEKIAEAEEDFDFKHSDSFAPREHLSVPAMARDSFEDVHEGH